MIVVVQVDGLGVVLMDVAGQNQERVVGVAESVCKREVGEWKVSGYLRWCLQLRQTASG